MVYIYYTQRDVKAHSCEMDDDMVHRDTLLKWAIPALRRRGSAV